MQVLPGRGARVLPARVEFSRGLTDILFDTRDLAVEAVYVAPAGFLHNLKGDVIPDTRYHRIASIGSWMLKTKLGKKTPLPDKIEDLIEKLTADLKVWAAINRRFSVDIFCGVFLDEWNRGYELPHALVKKIADRGLRIGFDIYGPATPVPLRKLKWKKSVRP